MNQDLLDLALGANRVLTYAGYVLLAGTLTFWSVVWPDGRRNRRLVVLAVAGTAAMIIGTVAGPADSADLRRPAARRHRHSARGRRPAGQARRARCRCLLPARHHQWFRGRLASRSRTRSRGRHRRHHGGPVGRHRRPLGDSQDRRDRAARAGDVRLARWAGRLGSRLDSWRQNSWSSTSSFRDSPGSPS